MDNAPPDGACTCCNTPVDIVWNSCVISSVAGAQGAGGEAQSQQLTCLDVGSNCCASVNGGGSQCGATAAKAKTWGAVKSLYR